MTGLAVGASSFAAAQAEALAQNSDRCGPVYDQTQQTISPELSRQIGRYASHGIKVHVQIFQESKTEGVKNLDDLRALQVRIADECGRSNSNALDVIISDNPRNFNIHRDGKASSVISDKEAEDATGDFVSDLKDFDTPHQKDVANLLEELYPFGPAPSNPEVSSSGGDGIDIPWKIIGGMSGLFMALGFGTARTLRGRRLRLAYQEPYNSSVAAYEEAGSVVTESQEELRYIPDTDAVQLRSAVERTSGAMVALADSQDALKTEYKFERRRIWPSTDGVDEDARLLDGYVSETQFAKDETSELLLDLRKDMKSIDTKTTQYSADLNACQETAKKLQEEGWDLGAYLVDLKRLDSQKGEVDRLREESYISQPSDILDASLKDIGVLGDNLKKLPVRRKDQDGKIAALGDRVGEALSTATKAKAVLDVLTSKHDPSCYTDIAGNALVLDNTLAKLRQIHIQAQQEVGKKSLASIEKGSALLNEFQATTQTIYGKSADITDRKAKLETLIEELPETVSSLEAQLSITQRYAVDEYPDDVENSTRNEIEDLLNRVANIKTTDLAQEKPKYLNIEESLKQLSNAGNAVDEKAHQQKVEMDQLRESCVQMEQGAKGDLQKLESYIQSHSGDVGGLDTSGIEIPSARVDLSRSELRAQQSNLDAINNRISDLNREARHRVEEADRRRRQEEEERRRREREAAIINNPGYGYGGGGHHGAGDIGGGFGGGDIGGGFGGGDTGGSF